MQCLIYAICGHIYDVYTNQLLVIPAFMLLTVQQMLRKHCVSVPVQNHHDALTLM